jgi:hypothetical protein
MASTKSRVLKIKEAIDRTYGSLTQAADLADELHQDLQSAFDELSEKAQESERGQRKQEELERVGELEDALQEMSDKLHELYAELGQEEVAA